MTSIIKDQFQLKNFALDHADADLFVSARVCTWIGCTNYFLVNW